MTRFRNYKEALIEGKLVWIKSDKGQIYKKLNSQVQKDMKKKISIIVNKKDK